MVGGDTFGSGSGTIGGGVEPVDDNLRSGTDRKRDSRRLGMVRHNTDGTIGMVLRVGMVMQRSGDGRRKNQETQQKSEALSDGFPR